MAIFHLQGEFWVFLALMCACANKGEKFWEKWTNKGDTCLIFEKLVVHRALRVHHFGGVALVRGKSFALGCFESLCFVSLLAFPSLSA